MRIIGGSLKGRAINPPSGFSARPTTDFAKEGLFNTLSSGFSLEGTNVLDLFAGTGCISYEFASRGASRVYAVEMNPVHASFIKRTAASLGLDAVRTVRHNVFDFLNLCRESFDIIFADPPYAMSGLDTLPERILGRRTGENGPGLLADGGLFILEHPASYSFQSFPGFEKEKKYGNVHFSFFRQRF